MADSISIPTSSTAMLVPFQITSSGGVAKAVGEPAVIKQHLISNLMTNHGERVMFPLFGANVQGRLFDAKDVLERQSAADDIKAALSNISTFLNIQDVRFYDDPQDPAAVFLLVQYSINNNSTLLTVRFLDGIVTDDDLIN